MEHVRCNLCYEDTTRPLFTLYGLHVVECKNCTLQYVNPRMDEAELVGIYNNNYYDNPNFYAEKELGHYGYDNYFEDKENIQLNFSERLKRINALKPEKGTFLDVGCAAGFVLDLARESGWEVCGVDLSEEAIEHATSKLSLDARHSTLKDAAFKDSSFDVVTILDVIEHLPDPRSEIQEIRRILKKDGLLVVTTPNAGALVPKIIGKHWLEYKRVREHIYFFSNKTLRRLLEEEGFNIKRVESTGRVFELAKFLEMATLHTPLVKPLHALVKNNALGRIRIHINPFYKTTMYAVKQ